MKYSWMLGGLLLAGCAHVDTGQVDYRVADAPGAMTEKDMSSIDGNRCQSDLRASCDPILPSRVVRRYMPDAATGWGAFQPNQVYSIEIEQGLIGSNILEGHVLGHQFGKTAEIAILANVFEFAGQESDAATRRFLEGGEVEGTSDDPSDVEMKLVYFSDDVKRRQPLNFSNIPLRPRSSYGGGSIGVQLVVMEVDAQAAPVASLLKTLAKFGQQALPIPGEAKDMLFDLGESLLTGSQDDKLLEYRFVLSGATEDDRAVQATFAPGRYVIRRSQERTKDMGWGEIRLDHNSGRLFTGTATGGFTAVQEDLYMVLNIRRYPEGTTPEYYKHADWSGFRATLQAAADARAGPLNKVTDDLTGLLVKMRSDNFQSDLRGKWSAVHNRMNLYSSRYASDFDQVDVATCKVDRADLKRRLDVAERELADAVRIFIADYQTALTMKRKDASGAVIGDEFAVTDRETLVSAVAFSFMPWSSTGATSASFGSAGNFEAAFVAAAPTDNLLALATAAARSNASANATCDDLVLR